MPKKPSQIALDAKHKPQLQAERKNISEYVRTYHLVSDGGDQRTHLAGLGDSTLCGFDAVGDDRVHRKPPVILKGHHRVTCRECLGLISIVREHLKCI